jgi:hypothetical protein
MLMRVRDQGGGVSPSNMERIFSYAFTTAGHKPGDDSEGVDELGTPSMGTTGNIDLSRLGDGNRFSDMARGGLQSSIGTIAGLGYGLPMSKLYAK